MSFAILIPVTPSPHRPKVISGTACLTAAGAYEHGVALSGTKGVRVVQELHCRGATFSIRADAEKPQWAWPLGCEKQPLTTFRQLFHNDPHH